MRKYFFWIFSILFFFVSLFPFSGVPRFGPFLNYSSGFIQIKHNVQDLEIEHNEFRAEILIDSVGIPHIYAKKNNGALFALGYMHAKDRYFQMEIMIRMVQGRLGELLGYRKRVLESDIFWRNFQFESTAKKLFNEYKNSELIENISAYSKGVNYYLTEMNSYELPEEYFLLDAKPREWKAHYSLLLVKYMAYLLTFKKTDIYLQKVINELPKEIVKTFYPLQESYLNAIIPEKDGKLTQKINYNSIQMNPETGFLNADDYLRQDNFEIIGSNSWVVSSKKSKSGNALLANDMHLKLGLPGPWYEAHIKTNTKHVYGQTIPASPFIIAGFNGKIAWGTTNAHWDLVDYYKIDYKDSLKNLYFVGPEIAEIKFSEEIISFKNKKDTVIKIRESRFGPILKIDGDEFAVNWTAKNNAIDPLTFQKLEKASDWNEFKSAVKEFKSPPQNFVFADTSGNIGLYTSGNMPIRRAKVRGVYRSSEIEEDHFDFIPFEDLPHIYNPEKGFIQSANQRQIYNYKYYVNWGRMSPPFRGKRIEDLLKKTEKLDVNDMQKIQSDVYDVSADYILPILNSAIEPNDPLYNYLNSLNKWNREMVKNSKAATIYSELLSVILKDYRLLIHDRKNYLKPNDFVVINYIKNNESLITYSGKIERKRFIKSSFYKAINSLKIEFGDDGENWVYGNYHQTQLEHILKINAFSPKLFSSNGSTFTVNVAKRRFVTHGSSQRHIFVLDGNEMQAFANIAGGQSGRPSNNNFLNQLSMWKDVKHRKVEYMNKEDLNSIVQTIKINGGANE